MKSTTAFVLWSLLIESRVLFGLKRALNRCLNYLDNAHRALQAHSFHLSLLHQHHFTRLHKLARA